MWVAVVGAAAAAAVSVIATARAYARFGRGPAGPGHLDVPSRTLPDRQAGERVTGASTRAWVASTLERTELFGKLDPEPLARVAAHAFVQPVGRGQTIFVQGSRGDRMYVIGEGEVKLVVDAAGGEEIELNRLAAPAFFGEFALIDGRPRSASAVATRPSTLIVITRERLFELLREEEVVDALLKALVDMVRELDRRTAGLDAPSVDVQGEVAQDLLRRARQDRDTLMVRDVSLADLADRVGATRQHVRRALDAFQDRGFISVVGGSIELLDQGGLRRQAAGRHG